MPKGIADQYGIELRSGKGVGKESWAKPFPGLLRVVGSERTVHPPT